MPDWGSISKQIQEAGAEPVSGTRVHAVGGGCISAAYVLGEGAGQYFVKIGPSQGLAMFAAELEGLQELAQAEAIKIPRPVCTGLAGNEAYLVMEYLPLRGTGHPRQLGEQLAALHRCQQARFGWHRDNTIGATPQHNPYQDSWPAFWRSQRLEFQLALARNKGAAGRILARGALLAAELGAFFTDYQPAASLLHGDLWSGNYGYLQNGQPVMFDPAVYYGDREADLAMTELFGGFPREFYAAYQAAYPLDAGYATRKTLYNLYHILNHYHLFGGGYLAQAENMIEQLLSEIH